MSKNPMMDVENEDILQDYTFSRMTYYKLIEMGMDSLTTLQELAKETEEGKPFELFTTCMKNIADINSKLIDLQDKHFNLQDKRTKKDPNLIEQEEKADPKDMIVFRGDTAGLLKKIEKIEINDE